MVNPFDAIQGALWARALVAYRLKGSEFDRLIGLLDERFGNDTGLSTTQLELWKEDDNFANALFAISFSGEWGPHREALRSAVAALIGDDPTNLQPNEERLRDEVVAAIEELLPRAKQGGTVLGSLSGLELARARFP